MLQDSRRASGQKIGRVDIRIDPGEFFQLNAYQRDANGKKDVVAIAIPEFDGSLQVLWKIYKGVSKDVEPYISTTSFDVCLEIFKHSFGDSVEITGLVEFSI